MFLRPRGEVFYYSRNLNLGFSVLTCRNRAYSLLKTTDSACSERVSRVTRPVVPGNLAQGDVAAGWVGLGFLDLIAIVPERLDAVRAFLGIKEAHFIVVSSSLSRPFVR